MAKIRFDANVAVEVALKFAEGKLSPTKLRDAAGNLRTDVPDQMFYSLCGDDTMYVSLSVAEKITALGIRPMELFSICKTVRNQVTKWEVKRVGDTATAAIPATTVGGNTTTALAPVPAPAPAAPRHGDTCDCSECESHWAKSRPTVLENQLTRSIEQAKVQRALTTPAAPQSTTSNGTRNTTLPQSSLQIHHTFASRTMASALIAAIDAAREAEVYAQAAGFEVCFETEDIRCMAATMLIQFRDQLTPPKQPQVVNGGAQWQQQ